MLPIKKILCPTDFSEPSFRALERAVELARHFSAELLLVHAVAPVPSVAAPTETLGFDVGAYQQRVIEDAENSLEEVLHQRVPEDVTARSVVVQGGAAREVLRVAEEEGVDLVVTASGGESGWQRFMFGSVAERMVRSAHCPVLVLPPGEE